MLFIRNPVIHTRNLTSHVFINYSPWSLGLIFSFALACGYSSSDTPTVTEFWTHNSKLRIDYQIKCKIIHFDPGKCFINLLKNNGSKT